MILFPDIVERLALPDDEGCLMGPVGILNRRSVAATLVNRHLLWESVGTNGFAEKGLDRVMIALGREQKIDGLPVFVHCTISIFPQAFDPDVGLLPPPALSPRLLPSAKGFLTLRAILDHPAIEGGVIHGHAPLLPHLL
jgi:hypothetical protein